MRFDIYVGKTLYISTFNLDQAFDTFKLWTGRGLDVRMKFTAPMKKAA